MQESRHPLLQNDIMVTTMKTPPVPAVTGYGSRMDEVEKKKEMQRQACPCFIVSVVCSCSCY